MNDIKNKKKIPLVSIACITYNQELYIKECIDGFLKQKTTFPIQIVIHDDASTDNTAVILKEYSEKYPDLIFPIFQTENQYSKGINPGVKYVFPKCTGKYIALCEGDDYWTDPYKLQKQVDFLEANEEYSICSHRYKVYYEDTKVFEYDMNKKLFLENINGFSFDLEVFFSGWYLHTLTVVLRKDAMDIKLLKKLKNVFDYMIFYSLMKNGKGYLLNFEGGIYRKHAGGVCTSNTVINHSTQHYNAFKALFEIEKSDLLKSIVAYHLFHHIKSHIKYSDNFSFSYIYVKSKELFQYKVSNYSFFEYSKMIIKAFLYRLIKNKP